MSAMDKPSSSPTANVFSGQRQIQGVGAGDAAASPSKKIVPNCLHLGKFR